jgi:group I intron endonuclease
MSKICGIYKIENKITGRTYIGRSIDIIKRWSWHKSVLKSGKHNVIELQEDYNKHGNDIYIYKIIEECDFYKLREREQYWLDRTDNLYNERLVAEQLICKTEEQKKISYISRSKAQSGVNNPRARLTMEDIAKIVELYELGYKQIEIAKMFFVQSPAISKIVNGVRWNKLGGI